jgi:hypothetical protein
MAEHCYVECRLCRLSIMLKVTYKFPYAECLYAERRGALSNAVFSFTNYSNERVASPKFITAIKT